MKYLKIVSAGLLDNQALTLIGASTKRGDDTKIGMFGSGFKYSLANLLRDKLSIRIFSGEREIAVTTKPVIFRDKEFEQIYIDGIETSLTTDMGGDDWRKPFPVFREIYSNALDEGGADLKLSDDPKGRGGVTQIYIEYTEDYKDFFENFDNYFTQRRTDSVAVITGKLPSEKTIIYPHLGVKDNSLRIFRKGILALHREQKSLFNYDLQHASINESRVLTNINSAKQSIYEAWNLCEDEKLFNKYIMALQGSNTGWFEHDCLQYEWRDCKLSEVVKNYIESKKWVAVEHISFFDEEELTGRMAMSITFLKHWNTKADLDIYGISEDNSDFIRKPIDADQFEKLEVAKDWLKEVPRYANLATEYTFDFGIFPGLTGKLAEAKPPATILMSHQVFDKSTPEITKVIIEEIEHLRSGYSDKSRLFQDHLFDLYYNELEKVKRLRTKYATNTEQSDVPDREV